MHPSRLCFALYPVLLLLLQSTHTAALYPDSHIINTMPTGKSLGWPGALPLEVDGYPVAPPELQLEQVHIYVRHGERTPVGVRMAGPPASLPEHWKMCHTARRFRAAVASTMELNPQEGSGLSPEEQMPVRKVLERGDGSVVVGDCLLGELTDLGRQTTFELGRDLRKLYMDRLGFLPSMIHSNDQVYFRSTNVPRTTESLQQIMHGLFPVNHRAEGFVPHLRLRNGKDENLFGNTLACKRLEILQIGFAQAAASAWNRTLEPLDKKVSKYIGGNPIRLDGKPRASGVLDTVRSAIAHGVPVPPEFKEKGVIELIEKAVIQEWFADRTEEVRRLGMGRLLSDVSEKMSSKAEKGTSDPMKILIHSTHDTTLSGLLSTLDVYDDRWPAFTAAVTFELFRRREDESSQTPLWQTVLAPFKQSNDPKEHHYVRTRYQNRNLPLPFCAEEGKHLPGSPEFCTLAAFAERVKELTPVDWEGECAPAGRTK